MKISILYKKVQTNWVTSFKWQAKWKHILAPFCFTSTQPLSNTVINIWVNRILKTKRITMLAHISNNRNYSFYLRNYLVYLTKDFVPLFGTWWSINTLVCVHFICIHKPTANKVNKVRTESNENTNTFWLGRTIYNGQSEHLLKHETKNIT